MRRPCTLLALLAAALPVAACGGAAATGAGASAAPTVPVAAAGPPILRGSAPALEGGSIALDSLRGKVVLLVNTASRCGYTPQYAGLEQLWQRFRSRGLVVLGQPSDSFRQEPGNAAEVEQVCRVRYGVSFPLLAKAPVTGPAASPLFRALAAAPAAVGAPPAWNFTKYLLDRHGRPLARFDPAVEPGSAALVSAIEAALRTNA